MYPPDSNDLKGPHHAQTHRQAASCAEGPEMPHCLLGACLLEEINGPASLVAYKNTSQVVPFPLPFTAFAAPEGLSSSVA